MKAVERFIADKLSETLREINGTNHTIRDDSFGHVIHIGSDDEERTNRCLEFYILDNEIYIKRIIIVSSNVELSFDRLRNTLEYCCIECGLSGFVFSPIQSEFAGEILLKMGCEEVIPTNGDTSGVYRYHVTRYKPYIGYTDEMDPITKQLQHDLYLQLRDVILAKTGVPKNFFK